MSDAVTVSEGAENFRVCLQKDKDTFDGFNVTIFSQGGTAENGAGELISSIFWFLVLVVAMLVSSCISHQKICSLYCHTH